jgi:hypothetical protein
VVLVAWSAVWIWVGVSLGAEVRGLTRLSDTIGAVGRAVEDVGVSLESLEGVPLIGGDIAEPAREIRDAGRSARGSARVSRRSAERVGTLLTVSIILIPTLPVLVLYLPERIAFARDRRAVGRALHEGDRAALDEVLALRAVAGLPYHRLRAVSDDPGADLAEGRHHRLAEAELGRLGLRRAQRAAR